MSKITGYRKKRVTASRVMRKAARAAVRKYNRKSVTKNKTSVSIGKGFPKRLVFTHKYHENTALTTGGGAGLLATYNYNCNSLYDPNETGTGHQPMYFDQLTAIYDHYTVIGAKMVLKFCSSGTLNSPFRVGIMVNDDAVVTPTTASALLEHSSNITWKQVPPGCNNSFVLTCKWSAKKTFGGSVLGNDNLQGSATTSPSERSMFTIFIESNDGATINTIVSDVYLEQIAVWDELKDIASS